MVKKDEVKLVRDVLTLKVAWCWCEIYSVSCKADSFRPTAYKKENNGLEKKA